MRQEPGRVLRRLQSYYHNELSYRTLWRGLDPGCRANLVSLQLLEHFGTSRPRQLHLAKLPESHTLPCFCLERYSTTLLP